MNPSVVQPLLELLKVENPADLTDQEIARFREWLRAAYEGAGKEVTETVEELPAARPVAVDMPLNTRPAWRHVDRVLQTLLAYEGRARKQMARRCNSAVKRTRTRVPVVLSES